MKLSTQEELKRFQAMRAELEAESRSLKEKQNNLENSVISLEEKILAEELKKEKAIVEELKNNNQAAKDAIAQLEAKKQELEKKINKPQQKPVAPLETEKANETSAQPEETAEALEPAEETPEESCVTITAIEGEALAESPEAVETQKQEKKKRRFF